MTSTDSHYPLFDAYPALASKLPTVSLASLPTPVAALEGLGAAIGVDKLYLKQDGVSGIPYGGNKVRKLEFLLGRAQAAGARSVITFGCAGSNHAVATAIYAKRTGMHPVVVLLPQPNAESVRRNLLLHLWNGTEIHHYDDGERAGAGTVQLIRECFAEDRVWPAIVPPGGSSPWGAFGYVNAAFELKAQIEAGLLPAPDVIYAASGTMGTVVGLALGLRAAGLDTQVMAIAVSTAPYTSDEKALRFYAGANTLLRELCPGFPALPLPEEQFTLRHEFLGECYGRYTEASVAAARLAEEREGLHLEGTYTGKALGGLMADAEAGALRGKTVLFWNTYNAQDLRAKIEGLDYHRLPSVLHRYFEEPVQRLDR